ncbi:tetrapyrrole biosynthesis, uroporphyrinogen III synthase [Massariosphaeria phaeospora]|uniref:Tetrapyrrole biosynthesis, uroporphyrinogen III synthase n=1 Tax=Massariosphaeria phaeospora TaxID=100035 RepID=A0A7C8IHX1_9PLEO|nr:tetrapyrrole biosynthesis, uroporphyrinogen III synthase [Massariosphaeria phaeospora]
MAHDQRPRIPILLLKTRSAPDDTYEDYFSTFARNRYEPVFVPVLEHRFKQDALDQVRQMITGGSFVSRRGPGAAAYGAMIFTSQRAVEAFTRVVEEICVEGSHSLDKLLPQSVPLYVVGPATARGLGALSLRCPILGGETGNSDALSAYILDHYSSLHRGFVKPALLFLVGDKRRDTIPRTLQSQDLALERRSKVDELIVYETGEMRSFQTEFSSIWQKNAETQTLRQWVVVFSPTGCKAMLESLGVLDGKTGRVSRLGSNARSILVATIGPTTRDYLISEFGFTPDVCAEKPSPEGVASGIEAYTQDSTYKAPDAIYSSPSRGEDVAGGTKRKAAASDSPKRDRKTQKKQPTIEEALHKQTDMQQDGETQELPANEEVKKTEKHDGERADTVDDPAKPETNGEGAIEESSQREKVLPSNILEKGVVYFLARNRNNFDTAESVGDLQRSYFVLRPFPRGGKLGEGPLQDLANNRLLALPKKTFPKSHNDRFMAFVEKAKTTIQELKDNFFKAEEYETKTAGTRHTEPITVVGEGVYAITRTEDRTTHLAYALTIPSELGEVQEDLGLRSQGSFVISIKNPERPGPANARLPEGPGFPKEIIEHFRGLAWSEVKPKYLDYPNAQILLIGEDLETATEPTTKDTRAKKETPKEELEQLEREDHLRVKGLRGDDSVFEDLRISKKDYPQVPTTW